MNACLAVPWGAVVLAWVVGVYSCFFGLSAMRGAHPFTPSGRAILRWRREKARRATRYINAGIEPGAAFARAQNELQAESRAVELELLD